MSRQIAVIGSGPSGCYATEGFFKVDPSVRVDIFDALPTPFGLVRSGVAPDHQGTKNIARVFERALKNPNARFWGNVSIGRDLSLSELLGAYDAVLIATGAARDRSLGIPGESLSGVLGSGAVTRWYNGHPEAPDLRGAVQGARSLVIIGQGNVALDVARVFAKAAGERTMTDFPRAVEEALDAASLTDIHVVGRRGPGETHFSPEMLAELERLSRAVLLVRAEDVAGLASEEANPTRFRAWSANTPQEGKIKLHFHFGVSPLSFSGEGTVSGVVLRAADGSTREVPAELVVRCIGFEAQALGELSPEGGHFRHEEGRIREGLYVAGWAGRGSSGTIATNRAEAHQVAARILSEVSEKAARLDVEALLRERGVRVAPFSAWTRIQAAEVAGARPERVREKLTSLDALLAAGLSEPT